MAPRWRAALILWAAAALCPRPSQAVFSGEDRGTASGTFLKLPWGARCASLGEACAAAGGGAEAFLWNTAALRTQEGRCDVSQGYSTFVDDLQWGFASGSCRRSRDSFGAALRYLSYGTVEQTDAGGGSLGSFSPNDVAVQFAYALSSAPVAGLDLGVAVEYVRSSLLTAAEAWSLNAGLLFPPVLGGAMRHAFVVRNLGSGLRFRSDSAPLPLEVRLGCSFRHRESWLWSADAVFPRDNAPHLAAGLEYGRLMAPGTRAYGRLGTNTRNASQAIGFAGVSVGLGIEYRSLGLDYSLVPMGLLGLAHQWSFHARFGDGAGPSAGDPRSP